MVYSNQQWCLMRWNQTTSVGSLGLMSTLPHLRPFFGMFAIFAPLIAQFSSTTSTQNSPISITIPLNSTTQLFSQCWTNTLLYINVRCLWEVLSLVQSGRRSGANNQDDNVDWQNDSGEQKALQFIKNCTTKRNTMPQNWSKKLSLFFTAQRLQQQLRAENSTPSPTNLLPEQNVPFYRQYFLSLACLTFSLIFS